MAAAVSTNGRFLILYDLTGLAVAQPMSMVISAGRQRDRSVGQIGLGCRWEGGGRPIDRLLGRGDGWRLELERTTRHRKGEASWAGLVSRMDKEGWLFLFPTMIWSYGVVRQIVARS